MRLGVALGAMPSILRKDDMWMDSIFTILRSNGLRLYIGLEREFYWPGQMLVHGCFLRRKNGPGKRHLVIFRDKPGTRYPGSAGGEFEAQSGRNRSVDANIKSFGMRLSIETSCLYKASPTKTPPMHR